METKRRRILVIKLGALGDFIQALGPMAAIRAHHKDDHITLLTTAPFEQLGRSSGYFDAVQIDRRPKWSDAKGWIALRKSLNAGNYARVYDLQNNDRTSLYFKLFSPKPEWSGAAKGASHRNASEERNAGKAFDGHVQTLAIAGVRGVQPDRLEWVQQTQTIEGLRQPYILIVPGASPKHPEKRWSEPAFAEFCTRLKDNGYQPVLIGGEHETAIARAIENSAPGLLNLTGKTALFDLPSLARGAKGAVGNDTGPMHLIAPTGCPSIVLFSGKSEPKRHAPLGRNVITIQKHNLKGLSASDVWKAFAAQHSIA